MPRRERHHLGDSHAQRIGRSIATPRHFRAPRRRFPADPGGRPSGQGQAAAREHGIRHGSRVSQREPRRHPPRDAQVDPVLEPGCPLGQDRRGAHVLQTDRRADRGVRQLRHAPDQRLRARRRERRFPGRHVPLRRESIRRRRRRRFQPGRVRRPEPALSAPLQQRHGQPREQQDHGLRDQPRGLRRSSARRRVQGPGRQGRRSQGDGRTCSGSSRARVSSSARRSSA